jgi:hypothetical protein
MDSDLLWLIVGIIIAIMIVVAMVSGFIAMPGDQIKNFILNLRFRPRFG